MHNIRKDEILNILEKSNDLRELKALATYELEFEDFNEVWGELIEKSHSYDREIFEKSLIQLKKNFCKIRLERSTEIKRFLIEIGAEGFVNNSDFVSNISIVSEPSDTQVDGLAEGSIKKEFYDEYSSSLLGALSEKDLSSMKIALLNLLLDNSKPVDKLTNSLSLVYSKFPEIFNDYIEDEINNPIDLNQDNWIVRYFHEQNLTLETNFSIKRYKHLLDVREFLRKKGESDFQFIQETKKSRHSEYSEHSGNSKSLLDELIDMLLESLSKIKDAGCNLIEKVKSKFK